MKPPFPKAPRLDAALADADLGDVWLVHAGVDPNSVEKTNCRSVCWVRDEFHSIPQPYFPDKLIIIGHTITYTTGR